MVWQHQTYNYCIHNILNVESQVPLTELQYFQTDTTLEDIDIQIRLDRQGTPSRLPGGISYDERLGRFGFGLTVLPGKFTQIIVSPLLEKSPNFLFTNVVEPILRWGFVRKDFALIKAAAVTRDGSAILIHSDEDRGKVVADLCRDQRHAFMADDLIIVGKNGQAFGYPKPVTIQQEMVRSNRDSFSRSNRLALLIRRSLYTRFTRRAGLWLSARDLPAATMNTYLQMLVPQPKKMLGDVFSGLNYAPSAPISQVVADQGLLGLTAAGDKFALLVEGLQQSEETNSFQPHPLLAQRLRFWQGDDLIVKERKIIVDALQRATIRWFEAENGFNGLDLGQENRGSKVTGNQERPREQSINRFAPSINAQKGTSKS